MLGEGVRDCKEEAARAKHGCTRTRGERGFEIGELRGRHSAVTSGDGLERCIEAEAQIKPATDAAKLDDLSTAENAAISCERCNGCA